MTIEEIEKEIQSLAEGQAGIKAALGAVSDRQERFERASQMLIELMRKNQARTAGLEERTSDLVELAHTHDGRLDSLEESQVHTDAKLDALVDLQIQSGHRFDAMTARVDAVTARLDAATGRTDESLAKLEAFIAETARQVRALVEGHEGNGSKPTQ